MKNWRRRDFESFKIAHMNIEENVWFILFICPFLLINKIRDFF